jgi:hypothetical protein
MNLLNKHLLSPFSGLGFSQPDGFSLRWREQSRRQCFNSYLLIPDLKVSSRGEPMCSPSWDLISSLTIVEERFSCSLSVVD